MRNMAPGNFAAAAAGSVIATGIALAAIPPASAAPVGGSTLHEAPSPAAEHVQYTGGRCDELRRACLYKRELGERGRGNCQQYRAACTSGNGYLSSRAYRPYPEYRAYRPYPEYRAYRPYYPAYRPTYWQYRYWD
jgi:hypothetical protein